MEHVVDDFTFHQNYTVDREESIGVRGIRKVHNDSRGEVFQVKPLALVLAQHANHAAHSAHTQQRLDPRQLQYRKHHNNHVSPPPKVYPAPGLIQPAHLHVLRGVRHSNRGRREESIALDTEVHRHESVPQQLNPGLRAGMKTPVGVRLQLVGIVVRVEVQPRRVEGAEHLDLLVVVLSGDSQQRVQRALQRLQRHHGRRH